MLSFKQFINLATRSGNLHAKLSSNSRTGAVEVTAPFELDGRQVVLLDMPSFDHTHKSEAEILRNIALELETKYVPIPVSDELLKTFTFFGKISPRYQATRHHLSVQDQRCSSF